MVDYNYSYKKYIQIAEAFSSGNTEKGNELLRKLNLFLAVAKASSDTLFPLPKVTHMSDKHYRVTK